MTTVSQRLRQDAPVLMDGATGTELERRGVPMNSSAWSGMAVATHPEVVRDVHLDYIRCGAEVIITNSFASGRHMLRAAGVEERTVEINIQAARLARQAREMAAEALAEGGGEEWALAPQSVWIAGSLSPMAPGNEAARKPPPQEMAGYFAEQAGILADGGVDLLILEMMGDIDTGCRALEAASATGLPVWVGFSCARDGDGNLVLGTSPEGKVPLVEGVATVMAEGGDLAAIMHSDVYITGPALEAVRSAWEGPTGAYPESGYFIMPHWQFVDIIAPEDFAAAAMEWVSQGVELVGGCCGIGIEHIRALAKRLAHVTV